MVLQIIFEITFELFYKNIFVQCFKYIKVFFSVVNTDNNYITNICEIYNSIWQHDNLPNICESLHPVSFCM